MKSFHYRESLDHRYSTVASNRPWPRPPSAGPRDFMHEAHIPASADLSEGHK